MSGKSGSVVLFLRDLPANFTRKDLKSFIQSELKKAGIRVAPLRSPCSNYTVVRITDRSNGNQEYHGLVEIRPARIAMQAMAALNGKLIAGRPVEVRRYRHRSPWARQTNGADETQSQSQDLEITIDSRRQDIKIEIVDDDPDTPSGGHLFALH